MSKVELAIEVGTPTPEILKALNNFNRPLTKEPAALARTIGHMVTGEEITDPREVRLAKATDTVLDVTNNGSRIGIDEAHREPTWGEIFIDADHEKTHSKLREQTAEERRIEYELKLLDEFIDRLSAKEDQAFVEAQQKREVLASSLQQKNQEVIALHRLCGAYALRRIALMNIPAEETQTAA